MKKSRLCFTLCLLMAATAMSFNSCSKDEADEDLLIGKWKVSGIDSYARVTYEGEKYEETEKLNESQYDAEYGPSYVTFYDNKTFMTVADDEEENGTWKLSGKTLILKTDSDSFSEEIKELTSSKLVLYSEYTESEDGWVGIGKTTTTYRKVK